jgi:hypothetical protein
MRHNRSMRWIRVAPPRRGGLSLAALLLVLSAVLVLAGCGESTPSATSVLQSGQQKFASTSSFHFLLTTQHPGSAPSLTDLYPTKAEGDVALPNKIQANVTVALGALSITTQVIAIGSDAWVLDPTSQKWQKTDQITSLTKIFDPQTGLGALLTQIDHPSKPADRSVGGTHCWSIHGTLPAEKIAGLIGASAPSSQPLDVSVCVGKDDHQLYLVSLTGQLIAGDTAQTEHDFQLSNFNKPVTISAPVVA